MADAELEEGPKTEKSHRGGILAWIERTGDALPDPVFIFLALIGLLVGTSVWASRIGWAAFNPVSGKELIVKSLLSSENIQRLLVDMPKTMTDFPPLGLVLVVMLGAAVAEKSGLFGALFGNSVRHLPKWGLTPAIFTIGLLSHHASDAAYVVLIPLAALVYAQAGRHPLAGIAAAYAGISGAFAGNLIPGQFDVLMLGITQAAARLIEPNYPINPLGNWWFTAVLGLVFIPIAWFITDKIVEPRLGTWTREGTPDAPNIVAFQTLTAQQHKGLRHALWVALCVVLLFASLTLWPGFSPLIDSEGTQAERLTPFYKSLIAAFLLLFFGAGWAYGAAAGTIKSHRDVVAMMGEGMTSMSSYLVLIFFAAHFVAMFSWSNLGPVMAVKGAQVLQTLDIPKPALLVALLSMSSVFDLVIGSASAKWSAMAPIVVPMLMLLGISPEMTTAAYRMGDSIFNIITPVASNFALVLILCQRWRPKFGVGSLVALMVPYSAALMATGFTLVFVWVTFMLPVGPGAPASYQLPVAQR
jgi:aminobenzoyl-glutamate transport protein